MSDDGTTVRRDETAYTKLETKIKRGTGTRDQDTTKVVTRHPNPKTAAKRHQQAPEACHASANAARSMQPQEDNDA